ncbi:hypothetical protein HOG27_06005 [bacterium]|nr:hypothetical protein [bacterium]
MFNKWVFHFCFFCITLFLSIIFSHSTEKVVVSVAIFGVRTSSIHSFIKAGSVFIEGFIF